MAAASLWLRRPRRIDRGKLLFWALGMGAALLWVVPFCWMISTSLKPEGQILRYPPEWLPREVTLESYGRVLSFQVGRWFWNSFVVATVSTLLTLMLNSAAGYAFLFDALGLPPWATFFVSVIAASLTRSALGGVLPGRRRWTRTVEWRRIDLDELLP